MEFASGLSALRLAADRVFAIHEDRAPLVTRPAPNTSRSFPYPKNLSIILYKSSFLTGFDT